jgi:tRNA pseudouridine55 synthase
MKPCRGFLILDKPSGMTSQAVVSKIRRAVGIRKAGHTGTLDPMATGVLPVGLGSATKVIPFLDESKKNYHVRGKLGIVTDTFDIEGEITQEKEWGQISIQDIEAGLEKFRGKISQRPPIYSAIKVKGKALYRYAREGKKVEIPRREVTVSQISLTHWDAPYFSLNIVCSRGTYIRSLIHDLGVFLGAGATVVELRRLATGPFHLKQAISLDEVIAAGSKVLQRRLVPVEDCLNHWSRFSLADELEVRRVCNGVRLRRISEALANGELKGPQVALSYQKKVVAFIQGEADGRFCYQRILGLKP